MDLESGKRKVAALTAPRNVVLVGASDRPGAWAARVWSNFSRYGFEGKVLFLNPKRDEIFGQPCYRDFAALPEPPDHLAVLVPAGGVVEAIRDGAKAGARSATIFAAGFGEDGDEEGVRRRDQLKAVIDATDVAVSGPNVLGNLVGRTRLVTLTDPRPQTVKPGPIALVGQSGGVLIHLNFVLLERGMTSGYILSSGNEIGLTMADYIAYFCDETDVKVIVCYIEAIADIDRFKAALANARAAGKSVIAVKPGRSQAGQQAALAHTGKLAGSPAVFDAVAGELGAIRANTLDDAVELCELLLHARVPAGRRLGAITLSGAYRGLLLDAADAHGLSFPELARETDERLRALFTVGAKVANPLDGGFGVLASGDTHLACVEAMDADPGIDMVLVQEELPRGQGNARTEAIAGRVEEFATTRATKPIGFVSFATHSQTDYSRALRARFPHVCFLNEPDKALRVIAMVRRCAELCDLARSSAAFRSSAGGEIPEAGRRLRELVSGAKARVLRNEQQSKELLRAYAIATPKEELVGSAGEAVRAADAIGYPVVLKIASGEIAHKSDVGGVALNLRTPAEVRAAYESILRNVASSGAPGGADGVLVCEHVGGGIELALGLHRDPEMGLVVMAGSGGTLLELVRDVAFAAPPIDPPKAIDMLNRTRIVERLRGYRGDRPHDIEAVVRGCVSLGRIACDLGEALESIDINPFVALREGALALDALVVARAR